MSFPETKNRRKMYVKRNLKFKDFNKCEGGVNPSFYDDYRDCLEGKIIQVEDYLHHTFNVKVYRIYYKNRHGWDDYWNIKEPHYDLMLRHISMAENSLPEDLFSV